MEIKKHNRKLLHLQRGFCKADSFRRTGWHRGRDKHQASPHHTVKDVQSTGRQKVHPISCLRPGQLPEQDDGPFNEESKLIRLLTFSEFIPVVFMSLKLNCPDDETKTYYSHWVLNDISGICSCCVTQHVQEKKNGQRNKLFGPVVLHYWFHFCLFHSVSRQANIQSHANPNLSLRVRSKVSIFFFFLTQIHRDVVFRVLRHDFEARG